MLSSSPDLAVVSLVLFFAGVIWAIALKDNPRARVVEILAVLLYSLFFAGYLVADNFTGYGINEATLFHLRYGLEGAGFSEHLGELTVPLMFLLLGLLVCVLLGYRTVKVESQRRRKALSPRSIIFVLLFIALVINPAVLDISRIYLFSRTVAEATIPFDHYYNAGKIERLDKSRQRNLVVIYLESFERSFLNETVFPGLSPRLKKLEQESVSFTDIGQASRTGWTIAGMVASQCGVPLFMNSPGNSMAGMDRFLPGAICLGDILAENGYRLSYYGGADLSFAGKGDFYASHQFDEIKGKTHLQESVADSGKVNGWGLFDGDLLGLAYQRFVDLSEHKDPFALFLLTLDMHHPENLSAECQELEYLNGENSMLNAVHCTDQLVADFIEKIRSSKFGEETNIVVLSDHLAMNNSAFGALKDIDRKNLFLILQPGLETGRKVDSQGTTLDVASTILPLVGARGKIGLGRDLLSGDHSLVTELIDFDAQLGRWRPDIEKLWSFPRITRKVAVELAQPAFVIDDRRFSLPILAILDDELATDLRFEFNSVHIEKSLYHQVKSLNGITPFIWADSCDRINLMSENKYQGEYCIAIGRLTESSQLKMIHGEIVPIIDSHSVDAEDLKKFLFE